MSLRSPFLHQTPVVGVLIRPRRTGRQDPQPGPRHRHRLQSAVGHEEYQGQFHARRPNAAREAATVRPDAAEDEYQKDRYDAPFHDRNGPVFHAAEGHGRERHQGYHPPDDDPIAEYTHGSSP